MTRAAQLTSAFAAAAFLQLGTATPAASQLLQSRVRAYSEDDDVAYNADCDPSPNPNPTEDGCVCNGPNYGPDAICMSDWLFTLSTLPGERVEADSFACPVDVCAISPLPQDGLGIAETDFGSNYVDVFASAFSDDPYIYDSAGAASTWYEEFTVSSQSILPPGAVIRANLQVRGSWQNGVCFVVNGFLARTDVLPTSPRYHVQFGNTPDVPDSLCLIDSGAINISPEDFEDYGLEDGAIDLVVPLEIPLVAPSKVALAGELRAFAEGNEALLDGANGGLEMTVESIEVPPGVTLVAATGTEYPVPEPTGGAAASIALAGLLALRRR